jgi:hypothetical protein
MKVSEVLKRFTIFMTNEERDMLPRLRQLRPLKSFPEHDQFVIEGMIRKSLVIKIGEHNPKVVANGYKG